MNPLIDSIKVKSYTFPTESVESDGTLQWSSTTLILVEIFCEDKKGIGYTYADRSCAGLIDSLLCSQIIGRNALHISNLWEDMHKVVRNNGHQGLCAMAISAVDIALWDLKAKILKLSLPDFLGRVRDSIRVYGSGGFCSFTQTQLKNQLESFANLGIKDFKIKVGADPDTDLLRIAFARNIITDAAALFVDANGAYTTQQALSKAEEFSEFNVIWFEEPVGSDNVAGLSYLVQKAPSSMEITTGEYGYDLYSYLRWAQNQAMHVAQVDVTRCGGITNFLRICDLLTAYNLPISTHTAPSLHRSLGLSIKNIRNCEYFSDHVTIEKKVFDGFLAPVNGQMHFPQGGYGLGLVFKEKDIEQYCIEKFVK